jgi:UTP--glucose-1-phosphate uridylyltransferase
VAVVEQLIVSKAVIPAAGIGSRLLPVTKEMPKEMLPVFYRQRTKALCLKPVLQIVFETLFLSGTRKFCIVVGRGKRAVEDYFTVDQGFISTLSKGDKKFLTAGLLEFYRRIRESSIVFMNQAEPLGFGDAVLCSAAFVGSDPFVLHAGDDLILSPKNNHMKRLKSVFTSVGADVLFFVEHTKNPEKYGVIRPKKINTELYRVKELVEKPKHPPSNLGVIAIYAFQPSVFEYLRKVKPDKNGEFQLADAVQMMVEDKKKVFAIPLRRSEKRVDIGSPDTYRLALKQTFR